MSKIYYKERLVKFEVTQPFTVDTGIKRPKIGSIASPYIKLEENGMMTVHKGYAWDGPSGPTIDTKSFMRGSLVHDAFYQLMRMGELPHLHWRDADKEFAKALREDGAWPLTIKIDLMGLSLAGGSAAHPNKLKRIYSVP